MRGIGPAALAGFLAVVCGPALGAGPRVASASVCGDQYVLALADPDQIAAVSPDADSPWLSLLAAEGGRYPRVRPGAEAYVALGVQVMLTNQWSDHKTAAMMERFGVTVVRIPLVERLDEVEEITRTVAAALGHPERGERLNAAIRERRTAVERDAAGQGQASLYLRPGGGTAAAGTFVDEVMGMNGLANQATAQGKRGWASTSLERFVLDPPEMIVTSFFDSPHPSVLRAFGNHPAFTERAAALPRVEVPGRSWVCSGWILIDAAERLAQGLRAMPRRVP